MVDHESLSSSRNEHDTILKADNPIELDHSVKENKLKGENDRLELAKDTYPVEKDETRVQQTFSDANFVPKFSENDLPEQSLMDEHLSHDYNFQNTYDKISLNDLSNNVKNVKNEMDEGESDLVNIDKEKKGIFTPQSMDLQGVSTALVTRQKGFEENLNENSKITSYAENLGRHASCDDDSDEGVKTFKEKVDFHHSR